MRKDVRAVVMVVAAVLVLAGCAEKGPVLLDNIAYQAPAGLAAGTSKVVVGVSPFRDERGKMASVLGKRTIRDYVQNDLVVQGSVAGLVTQAMKDALKARGITVKDAPAWDLRDESITPDGYDILIGGEIKTCWVDVVSRPLNVKETATVQLRVVAADPATKQTFRTLVLNSSMEQEDVAFSFASVEGVISEALSGALDQFLKDDDVKKRIQ